MSASERTAFLVGVLAFVLSAGWVTWNDRRAVHAPGVCEAAAEGRWQDILAETSGPLGSEPEDLDAAECRCWALLATRERDGCVELMGRRLADPATGDWLPDPLLAGLGIRWLRDRSLGERAAEVAARATETYPRDRVLAELALATRADRVGEDVALAEALPRLDRDDDGALRLAVASLLRSRGDHGGALAALGEDPPEEPSRADAWFEARTASEAALGDLAAVRASFDRWRERRGDDATLRARYALRLSLSQLADPDRGVRELLAASLAERESIADPEMVRLLTQRAIAHALADGDVEHALALFDAAPPEHAPRGITRQQIARQRDRGSREPGSLEFVVPEALAGGRIELSPGVEAAPDAGYEAGAVEGGRVRFERRRGPWPERWVARDARGRPRGSGRVWPQPGETRRVEVVLAPPSTTRGFAPTERPPPDGRRRVLALVYDCADWRLAGYLSARGELPVFDHLREHGWSAVLWSDPPLTAAAMESLVWPERERPATVLAWAHQLGVEIAGLEGVAGNPMDFLEAALPRGSNLFEVIGAGPRRAANMLFSHGMIDGGAHATIVGPHGAHRSAPSGRAARPLSPAEQAAHPALLRDPRARPQVERIAAELDQALAVARDPSVDFLFLRVEAVDLLTHAFFAELVEDGQDDGDAVLLEVYRYLDARTGALWEALDGDDVLVVMSDHGIRTSMQHAEDAIFVAAGGGLPHGRAPGTPDLRGVPSVLAGWLGVETTWPDHALAPPERLRASR